jgi:hypothetical protein
MILIRNMHDIFYNLACLYFGGKLLILRSLPLKSSRVLMSFNNFSDFVLGDAGIPPPNINELFHKYNSHFDELLLEILQSLFYQKVMPVDDITCPIDLILMLIWLKDSGFAVSPSQATHDCVIFQYWAYTMVVHTSCVNIPSIPYVNKYRILYFTHRPVGSH